MNKQGNNMNTTPNTQTINFNKDAYLSENHGSMAANNGRIMENAVCDKFRSLDRKYYIFPKGHPLRRISGEGGFTFDVDGFTYSDNKVDSDGFPIGKLHLVEVKKSVNDSSICKIFLQYKAWKDKMEKLNRIMLFFFCFLLHV